MSTHGKTAHPSSAALLARIPHEDAEGHGCIASFGRRQAPVDRNPVKAGIRYWTRSVEVRCGVL